MFSGWCLQRESADKQASAREAQPPLIGSGRVQEKQQEPVSDAQQLSPVTNADSYAQSARPTNFPAPSNFSAPPTTTVPAAGELAVATMASSSQLGSSNNALVHNIYAIGKDTGKIYTQQVRKLMMPQSPWTVAAAGTVYVPVAVPEDGKRNSVGSATLAMMTLQAGESTQYEILVDGLQVTSDASVNAHVRSRKMSMIPKGAILKVVEVRVVVDEDYIRGRIADPYGWISLVQRSTGTFYAREMAEAKVVSIAVDYDTIYGVFSDRKVYKQHLKELTPSSLWMLASKELPFKGVGKRSSIAIDGGVIYGVSFDRRKGIYEECGKLVKQMLHQMTPSSPWALAAKDEGIVSMAFHHGTIYGVLQDQKIYRQQVNKMKDGSSSWSLATGGNMTAVALDTINAGTLYGVGADKRLYKQEVDTISPSSQWVLASASSFLLSSIAFAQSGDITMTFQPGNVGISADRDSGEVLEVYENGQAISLGVEIGMQIILVNNYSYSNRELAKCAGGDQEYKVTFRKTNGQRSVKHVHKMLSQWKQVSRVTKNGQGTDVKGSFNLTVGDPAAFTTSPAARRSLQQAIADTHDSIEGIKSEWVTVNVIRLQMDNVRVEYNIEVPASVEVKLTTQSEVRMGKALKEKLEKNGMTGGIAVCTKINGEATTSLVGSCLPAHALHRDDRIATLMAKGHTEEDATHAIGKHSTVEHAEQWINEKPHEVLDSQFKSQSLDWAGRMRKEMKDEDPKGYLLDSILDGRAMSGLERSTGTVDF